MNKKLPSKRTARKFGRDMAYAVGTYGAVWIAENATVLELSDGATMILVAVALGLGRWIRDRNGDPAA